MNEYEDNGAMGMGGGSYSNPMYNFAGSIIEMTDSEDLFGRLENNLRGRVTTSGGQMVTSGSPLMNDKGVKDIVMIMRSFGDRASVMSFFDGSEIKVLMEMLNDILARTLMLNYYNYGFDNPSGRDLVVFMCNACGFAVIKRGFEGGERKFWKGSQLEYSVKSNAEKKGVFSGLFGKKA
jgi:hypothetical protein